jgi:hypothetical protein
MGPEGIRSAVSAIAAQFATHPEDAKSEDKPPQAVLGSGLRISVEGPGSWLVTTDMPAALGGEGSAPGPGWLRRASQAACEATMIAIRAAREGAEIQGPEALVGSLPDDRDLLGLASEAKPGPSQSWTKVTSSAKAVSRGRSDRFLSGQRHIRPSPTPFVAPSPTTFSSQASDGYLCEPSAAAQRDSPRADSQPNGRCPHAP